MSFAIMPLSDYKAACDKVREKVDLTTVKFEETDFGFLRSEVFTVPKDGVYIFSYEFSDPSKFPDLYYNSPEWEGETSPGYFEPIDSNSAKTASELYAGVQYRIFIADDLGLTPKDILKAALLLDEETVVDFVAPPKIKSGELAEKVDEVYKAGAYDFGLKGKGQAELVHFDNVHPIEHKVEVGLSSKNLFNKSEANITKIEDYFASNIAYWQGPCLAIPVESGATYTCSCEYYTPNTTNFNTLLAYSISKEKTYTSAAKALAIRLKTQSSTDGYYRATDTFTVPDGIEEVYFLADNEGSGTFFKKFQIEKSDTPTAYAPFVADFSDCKVKASGKNLAPINEVEVYTNTTENPFNYVTVWEGSLSGYSRISWKYDLQSIGSASAAFFRFTINGAVRYAGADITWLNYPINNETLTKIEVINWSGSVGRVYDIQLEVGSTFTAFEPYIGAEYTAAADGTVEGVKSISPVMNLMADKAGAVIDAECFLDPQAVITDLTNTVITLGGEI